MAARRSKRVDGRYAVTARFDEPDGMTRRVFFYGRTQAEAKAKADAAPRALGGRIPDPRRHLLGRRLVGSMEGNVPPGK